jgi:hypothetical protein
MSAMHTATTKPAATAKILDEGIRDTEWPESNFEHDPVVVVHQKHCFNRTKMPNSLAQQADSQMIAAKFLYDV